MFIQTDILEKNGAQKMERCMFINIEDACSFVDNERKTQVSRKPADKEGAILMTNACFCSVV